MRIRLYAFLIGLPGAALSFYFLWGGDYTPKVRWTFTILIGILWYGFAFALQERVIMPLQTLSNLLSALREGDYSIRGSAARFDDTLGDVVREVNMLSSTLRKERLGAIEASALLRTVMAEIDIAVFAFDSNRTLRLVNKAGEKLLNKSTEQLIGKTADELNMSDCLDCESVRILQRSFPGGIGRFGLRRNVFREGGKPHQLLVIADLSLALREEERLAWQRIIRVMGHELNNSLTPIKSIAGSLENLITKATKPDDWPSDLNADLKDDLKRGLSIIAARAESLNRFVSAYSQLAKLPPPNLADLDVAAWVRRTATMETRENIEILPGPNAIIRGDSDQLEQVLINLIRNAVEASNGGGGVVSVRWSVQNEFIDVIVEDDGPGLSNTTNLFVPFFTTKPGGSGIGLAISRQIVENHGGALTLENKMKGIGVEARLRLPL